MRPSRRPLRGLLRMTFFLNAIINLRHPEEARSAVSKDARWHVQHISKRRAGLQPVAHDFLTGGEPYLVVRCDVAERLVEPGDAVRHADQIGVEADRHDPARMRALGVERVELALYRGDELVDRAVAGMEERRIVDLVGIGDRHEPLAADIHQIGLVVIDPIGDIETALFDQVVERVPGLGEPRPEPADRLLAAQRGDLGEGPGDRLAFFLRLHLIEPARIGLVMAEDLPAELDRGLHDLRVMVANVAVEVRAGADAALLQHLHNPPDADPVAVVALRPGAHRGGWLRTSVVRAAGDADAQRKELDIGDDPDRKPGAARPFELWPLVDGDIAERAIIARFHRSLHRGRIETANYRPNRRRAVWRLAIGRGSNGIASAIFLRRCSTRCCAFARRSSSSSSARRFPISTGSTNARS